MTIDAIDQARAAGASRAWGSGGAVAAAGAQPPRQRQQHRHNHHRCQLGHPPPRGVVAGEEEGQGDEKGSQQAYRGSVSYTHLTLPTIDSV